MTDTPHLKAWTPPTLLVIDAASAQNNYYTLGDSPGSPSTAHKS
jgi:hypothetical protein